MKDSIMYLCYIYLDVNSNNYNSRNNQNHKYFVEICQLLSLRGNFSPCRPTLSTHSQYSAPQDVIASLREEIVK